MAEVVLDANVLVGLLDDHDVLAPRERKSAPPDLTAALTTIRGAAERGEIRFVGGESERLLPHVLNVVEETGGRLNFNDALLVALQREGSIGDVASFDQGLDAASGFRRIS